MMAMVEAMMAFQRQAGDQLRACAADLSAAGLGFSADDRAAIAAAARAHQGAAEAASSDDVEAAQDVASRALAAVYPPDGFPANDPRLKAVDGVSLPLYTLATRAIGWAGSDVLLVARVIGALGIDADRWTRASAAWTERIRTDVVLAAFYGQLFAQAADV
jgi:hypothetical protein